MSPLSRSSLDEVRARVVAHLRSVDYPTVAKSVAVFLGIPLGAAIVTRFSLRRLASPKWYDQIFLKFAAPWSLIGLLFTILILFASAGKRSCIRLVSVVRVLLH